MCTLTFAIWLKNSTNCTAKYSVCVLCQVYTCMLYKIGKLDIWPPGTKFQLAKKNGSIFKTF